jgi:hypothetical protein
MLRFRKTDWTVCVGLFFISGKIWALENAQVKELIHLVDERQRSTGDYASLVFIDQKDKQGSTKAYEARVYRRDVDDKWMILFTKPKAEAGKGYLRIERNMFLYEPALGKWERQTERASIVGTSSRRDDFDQSRLAEEYDAKFIADEVLGKFKVHRLELKAKPHVEVVNPLVSLWIDQDSKNVLKRQEFAMSGKLMRTTYYPGWSKMFSKSKGADVYVPKEIRVFDEVEKGSSTTIVLRDVKLEPLDANMFSKAWLEMQSR